MNDACLVFMTHKIDEYVISNIQRYRSLMPEWCDFILLCQDDQSKKIQDISKYFNSIVLYSEQMFKDAGYLIVDQNTPIMKQHLDMWGQNRWMIFNITYLFPYMFQKKNMYEHYFFVEYDVLFKDDGNKFKEILKQIKDSDYDFVPACIENWFDIFNFSRFNRLSTVYPNQQDFKKAFVQLAYMNKKFINKMNNILKEWNTCQAETFYITMSNHFKFKSTSFEILGYVDRIDYSCDGGYNPPMTGNGCFIHPFKNKIFN